MPKKDIKKPTADKRTEGGGTEASCSALAVFGSLKTVPESPPCLCKAGDPDEMFSSDSSGNRHYAAWVKNGKATRKRYDRFLKMAKAKAKGSQRVGVNVQTLSGNSVVITVPASATPMAVKHKISRHWDIPVQQQRLYLKGKLLDDARMLRECGVRSNCTLNLTVRLQGGGPGQANHGSGEASEKAKRVRKMVQWKTTFGAATAPSAEIKTGAATAPSAETKTGNARARRIFRSTTRAREHRLMLKHTGKHEAPRKLEDKRRANPHIRQFFQERRTKGHAGPNGQSAPRGSLRSMPTTAINSRISATEGSSSNQDNAAEEGTVAKTNSVLTPISKNNIRPFRPKVPVVSTLIAKQVVDSHSAKQVVDSHC